MRRARLATGPRDLPLRRLRPSPCERRRDGTESTAPPRMVLRRLLLALLSNQQLVERLAEARPIRSLARVTASALTRGLRLRNTFLRELKEEAARAKDAAWTNQRGGKKGRGS